MNSRRGHFDDGALFGRLQQQLMSDTPTGGGYSVHMRTGQRPYGQWMVGNPRYKADIYPAGQGSAGRIQKFVNERRAGLDTDKPRFAGGWRDQDSAAVQSDQMVYQDVSDAFENRNAAFYTAVVRNEKAIVRHPDQQGRGFEEVRNPHHMSDEEVATIRRQLRI